jgi:hypothetical protein
MTEQFEPIDDETAELSAVEADGGYSRMRLARVNLLPSSVLVERRQRRVALYALGLLTAFLVGLGAVYALQVNEVNDARARRDRVEREVAILRAEVASLGEYQQLLDTVQNRATLLTATMEQQLSWARVLGDLALQLDRQASLIGLTAASTEPDVADPQATSTPDVNAGVFDLGEPVAQIEFTGYSVDRLAPGVEEVLKKFDDTVGFDDAYLSTAGEEERGTETVTNFIGEVQIDDRAYTHRYDEGLPEESMR